MNEEFNISISFTIPKIKYSNNESIIDYFNKEIKLKYKEQLGDDYLDYYKVHVTDITTTSGYHSQDTDYEVKIKVYKILEKWEELVLLEERLRVGL